MKKIAVNIVAIVGMIAVAGSLLYSSSEIGGWLASLLEGKTQSEAKVGREENIAVLKTNFGDIKIKLHRKDIPNISKNFIELSKSRKYNGTIFHRVINDFMIQGGDYENFDGTGGSSYLGKYLKDEFSEKFSHIRGAVSMANKGPNTNSSQFFVVQKDAPFLDGRHSIFGQVIEGMDIVDKIALVDTDNEDRPLKRVVIEAIVLE